MLGSRKKIDCCNFLLLKSCSFQLLMIPALLHSFHAVGNVTNEKTRNQQYCVRGQVDFWGAGDSRVVSLEFEDELLV